MLVISAPQVLLSGSLVSLLVGLGIYFGFIWTKQLDKETSPNGSRDVFITYVVGVGVCLFVYSLSRLLQDTDERPPDEVLSEYMLQYLDSHPQVVRSWHVELVQKDVIHGEWYLRRVDDPTAQIADPRLPRTHSSGHVVSV